MTFFLLYHNTTVSYTSTVGKLRYCHFHNNGRAEDIVRFPSVAAPRRMLYHRSHCLFLHIVQTDKRQNHLHSVEYNASDILVFAIEHHIPFAIGSSYTFEFSHN